jgi:adenylate cyclase
MSKFVECKLVMLEVDLAGYARWAGTQDAVNLAAFLDRYYRRCADEIRSRGGRVVKFIGDGCLATFPPDEGPAAIAAAEALVAQTADHDRLQGSANVHVATVAAGDFGPDDDKRFDIVGAGVNHLFLMGGAPGIRISEPIYRQLPNDARSRWHKHKPPATYTLR